jgi:hypothetical protein
VTPPDGAGWALLEAPEESDAHEEEEVRADPESALDGGDVVVVVGVVVVVVLGSVLDGVVVVVWPVVEDPDASEL